MKLRTLITAATFTLVTGQALAQGVPPQGYVQPQQSYVQAPAPGQPIPPTDPNGAYCREYTQPVTIGGVKQSSYGTACQQPDGTWKILPSNIQAQANAQTPPIEYLGPPQYTSQPVYMVPPPVYYQPSPYYGPYPYPYAYGGGVSIGLGFGGGHGCYHCGWRR
jgi:hypothetical protein